VKINRRPKTLNRAQRLTRPSGDAVGRRGDRTRVECLDDDVVDIIARACASGRRNEWSLARGFRRRGTARHSRAAITR